MIAADGNLVIVVGRVSYMLSNISSSGNTSATLLDSGNLVLNDRRSGDILWQSFDYPTDTLLPGMKVFTLVPEMAMNYFYSSIYVSNEKESYYTCSMKNPLVTVRFVLDISGQLQVLTRDEMMGEWDMLWAQPWAQCDVYAYCGAFGTCNQRATLFCQCFPSFQPNSVGSWNAGNMSGRCVRKAPLQCGNDSVANGQKYLELIFCPVFIKINFDKKNW
ncbi:hypothetical protein RHGRI_009559 [Rhododendron griersonianum]|uniref:Bulb-type lectin domain-containing protein n=1 Tax=Rhododendron griersonianum TaxID=479676 RepID=A0AAV6KF65_9ERIC|nr:hypothetical protein RHGRI_009559 [Rhododendron griersonianum]